MARFGAGREILKCSFCGKSQHQVTKIIAGPGVYICDECIALCNEIIVSETSGHDPVTPPTDGDVEAAARAVNEAVSRLHRLALQRRAATESPPLT